MPKALSQSAKAIFFSQQLDYSIASILFQVQFEKGEKIMYVLRASYTKKDGSKVYAKDYGKRAFPIWIGPEPKPKPKKK